MGKYQWHGEDVQVKYGFAVVPRNTERPYFWTNFYCEGAFKKFDEDACKIRALQITSKDGQTFTISNIHGEGIYKLLLGGYPNAPHRSIDNECFTEVVEGSDYFDENNYGKYGQEKDPPNMDAYHRDQLADWERVIKLAEETGDTRTASLFKNLLNERKNS